MILKKIIKWIVWIPAIIMMIIIFSFSNANSEKSSNLSGGIISNTLNFIDDTFSLGLEEQRKEELVEGLQTPIRKLAHMTEYMILAITFMFALYIDGLKGKRLIGVSLLLGIGYASLDEFHQLFIPGRSGEIRDVCVDTIGIILGVLFYRILLKVYNMYFKRKL